MKTNLIKTALWLLAFVAILSILSIKWSIEDTPLPALGNFLSPSHGFWQNAESTKREFRDMTIAHPSLTGQVEVVFDDRLVPHIFASNDYDAGFAQGYIHAMLRLWQMDISTRFTLGRLSEVLGDRALQTDIDTRRKGILWAAEKALFTYSKDSVTHRLLNAYTDGVNHYIKNLSPKDYPIEFKLLDYVPGEWTTLHSVSTVIAMARTLSMREYDRQNTVLLDVLGREHFNTLFPNHLDHKAPVHPGPWNHINAENLIKEDDDRLSFLGTPPISKPADADIFMPEINMASNNWAVSGEKSKSGNPILCSDPHLGLSLPSIWIENHLITPESNVYGVSFTGMPAVIIGFNQHVAWGFTNGSLDVADWLKVEWKDESKSEYLYENNWIASDFREEIIKVKGQQDHTERVPYTRWGPVAEESEEGDLVFKWTAHETHNKEELQFFPKLNKAKTVEECLELCTIFPSVIQNMVMADRGGSIAMRSQGYWPLRHDYSGQFIGSASDSKAAWSRLIPFKDIPETVNPDRDFVSSANQKITNDEFPYIYFGVFGTGRGRILNRILEQQEKFDIEDMMDIQLSDYSIGAEEALPLLIRYLKTDQLRERHIDLVNQLKAWNFRFNSESPNAAFYSSWLRTTQKLTFDEIIAAVDEKFLRIPSLMTFLELLRSDEHHHFFDIQETELIESPYDIVTDAFLSTWTDIEEAYGSVYDIRWSDRLQQRLKHMASIDAFSKSVNVHGHYDALNAMSTGHGPSWRMIVELTPDGPIAKGVNPGGQSGNPGSKYYDNAVHHWEEGMYFDLKLPEEPDLVDNPLFTLKLKQQ